MSFEGPVRPAWRLSRPALRTSTTTSHHSLHPATIKVDEPFLVGDRVKTRFKILSAFSDSALESKDIWSAGTIVSLDGKVAIVAFDDLAHFKQPSVRQTAWRIERLEHEYTFDLGEEYL